MNKFHKLAVAAAGCALSLGGIATPASAAENITQETLTFPVEIITTCAGGAEVGLGFDIVRNIHIYTNKAGEPIRVTRNVNFTGVFELLPTGDTYTFQGTRIVTENLVAGTFTSVGNYRTVTQPGSGVVFHSAGREMFDQNDALVFSSGPKYDELSDGAQADVCGLFGLAPA